MTVATLTSTDLQIWAVDPLTKVFQDDAGPQQACPPIDIARGEVAEWQLVLRSAALISDIRVSVDALASLGQPQIRSIAYVEFDRSVAVPSKDMLREAPAEYPDPLMEDVPSLVPANVSQPFWIDLPIPMDAKPGLYSTLFKMECLVSGTPATVELTLQVEVHPVTVGASRLWVTNWFYTHTGNMEGASKPGSPEEDAYLAAMAKNMAAHRQNVAIINPFEVAAYSWDAEGKLKVDFARFDTWVKIFTDAGVLGRIEGGHVADRLGEWETPFVMKIKVLEDGEVKEQRVAPDSPEADLFYSQYFPQLMNHLKAKNLLDRYDQHLADEPIDMNADSYLQMAHLVRKYAPGLKTFEATHTKLVEGAIDVWVPQLDIANQHFEFFKARQEAGDEFWMYTCMWPAGEYANRFIEFPLIKTRLLHWLNFRYGITGYLHWGYNFWVPEDPFMDATRTKAKDGWGGFLPAGDSWIVYPKDGKLLDSIRHETMRDGIADYELLAMLGERNPSKAQELASRLVKGFEEYETGIAAFRQVRKELLQSLEG